MNPRIDGNMVALARFEREQDALQRADDRLEEAMSEIWDTPALLVQAIREASGLDQVDDAIERHARRMIEERNCDAREAEADDDYYRLRGML